MNIKNIANFIFELGQLKRQKHTGFQLVGVENPHSVAEHSLRAAQIGYILAEMEGASPEKVAAMLVIHDNAETRIGDQNKVNARYFKKDEAEILAFSDQLQNLSDGIASKWREYFNEFEGRTTKEAIVAKDADWLETAFQAKEYCDIGYSAAEDWINNISKALETESAKKIISEMKNIKFTDWWGDLKKMTHVKLGVK